MLVLLRPRDRRNLRGGVLWQTFMQFMNESEWDLSKTADRPAAPNAAFLMLRPAGATVPRARNLWRCNAGGGMK